MCALQPLKLQLSRHTMQQPFSEGDEVKISKTNIREHETTPPEYFNEGSLLKAMENPQ
jgi:DNA topoisomerase-3